MNVLEPNDHSMVTKELESVKHDLQQLKAQNSALESENARLQSLLVSSSKMDVLNKSALNGLSKHLKVILFSNVFALPSPYKRKPCSLVSFF